MSAPLGEEPLGENSESCVNHERYRRCKRGEAFKTKVSHWVKPGRQNAFDEAQVRRPAHAVFRACVLQGWECFCFGKTAAAYLYAAVFLFLRSLRHLQIAYHLPLIHPPCFFTHLLKAETQRPGLLPERTVRARPFRIPDLTHNY